MNYHSLLNYYHKENTTPEKFINKLKEYKILNVFTYPTTISDILNEYNEISLLNGTELNLYFKTAQFNRAHLFLMIPAALDSVVIDMDPPHTKFLYQIKK